jgi:hypothetical protein
LSSAIATLNPSTWAVVPGHSQSHSYRPQRAQSRRELPNRQYITSDNEYCSLSYKGMTSTPHGIKAVPRANEIPWAFSPRRASGRGAVAIRPCKRCLHHGKPTTSGGALAVHSTCHDTLGGWIKWFLKPRYVAGLTATPLRPSDARFGQWIG